VIRAAQSALISLLVAIALHLPARAGEPVDLLLVLAADVSRSVDQPKFQLQRAGYAAAISHPRVLSAITSGVHRRIALCFIEWSGPFSQRIVIDWTLVGDAAAARRFGDQLLEAPRAFSDRTSISAAIDFATTHFDKAPYRSDRRTIDVSGDGDNNSGRSAAAARDSALALGITINGLVILTENPMPGTETHTHPPGGLEAYYRDNVIGGVGAFVIVAQDFNSFGDAIVKKLVAEIAGGARLRHAANKR
jgi:Protein of unknown function (DUF1194)